MRVELAGRQSARVVKEETGGEGDESGRDPEPELDETGVRLRLPGHWQLICVLHYVKRHTNRNQVTSDVVYIGNELVG